jgi:hypothetical protein
LQNCRIAEKNVRKPQSAESDYQLNLKAIVVPGACRLPPAA